MHVLLIIPIIGIFLISTVDSFYPATSILSNNTSSVIKDKERSSTEENVFVYTAPNEIKQGIEKEDFKDKKEDFLFNVSYYKKIALLTTLLNLIVSLVIYMLFDFSNNQFQFIQENLDLSFYDVYLGVDGISIYFVLLTTIIMPIALVSNWNSIINNVKSYLIIMLLLETLLLAVFLVLDVLLFYIFFESILPPLFILIGLFGSNNKVRASFYIFLYTFDLKCKRAKHRRSPKAPVTKGIEKFLLLAWLMTQGMVTSLVFRVLSEKLLLVVDMWVIAVLNYLRYIVILILILILLFHKMMRMMTIIYFKGVKEQRVDGSSKSRNLDFVRCTLVAGKPVFRRKISSHSDNNIISKNMFKRFSTKSSLNPWFVTGLVDAEGCFILGVFKNDKYKMGYQIQAIFKITLHNKDYDLLCQVKDYFGSGSITKHGETTLQYTIKSLKDLERIISHFDTYPLLSQKWVDYKFFKDAISLIKDKKHLNLEGFREVISIKASMNLGLSDEFKLSFPDIKPRSRLLHKSVIDSNRIDPNWIAGLASGDGCFYISIRNSPATKLGKSVVLKFHIVQHSRDIELIKLLISSVGCGRIELALEQSAVYFVVTNFKDISEKIIPLFDKYPIQGVKALNYSDFKKIVNLIQNKEHLTEEGLLKIQSIKSNMNIARKL